MKTKANRFLWLTFLCFALSIPISSFISTRILVFLFALALVLGERRFNFLEFIKSSWDILIYLLIICIGLMYSSDKISGIRALETSFALLALPAISFRISNFKRENLITIFLFFSLGLLGASLICMLNALHVYLFDNQSTQVFFFYQFTNILDFQPTYFAYYLVFGITFGLYLMSYEKSAFHTSIIVGVTLFFFFVLMLTGGRTSFISLILVFSFFILRFFLEERGNVQKLTFGLIVTMTICMFATSAYEQDDRVLILNDSWDRYDLWKSAISANTDVFFGVGTGDYKIVLNKYFHSHGMAEYETNNLNAHNQFIQIFLSNGILGLMSLIILLGRPLVISFRRRNTLGILVFFPFLLYGITEVFLGRYQGVVFFAFLHQVLMAHLDSTKPTLNLKHP
jgi:O-antigen ligase